MAKKRKSLATSLDEVDRSMYSTFSSTANSLTQLYTQAMNQQKLSFQAGERHGLLTTEQLHLEEIAYICKISQGLLLFCLISGTLIALLCEEKLYHWILRQQEGGARVTTIDVINYLQNELDCSGEEPSMSPRAPAQHPHLQSTQFANTNLLVSSGSSGVLPSAQAFRPEPCDSQPRNYVFSNALSSPVRRSLQNYHISPGSYFQNNVQPIANANRGETNFIHQLSRDPNPGNSNDSSMDMHAD